MTFTTFDPSQVPNVLPKSGGTMSGNISFSPSTNGIVGTTTNNDATAGNVGEYVSSTVTSVAVPATGVIGDATSISLTAGDWDVSAMAAYNNGGGNWTGCSLGISTTSGNSATGLVEGANYAFAIWGSTTSFPVEHTHTVQPQRFSLSTTTTVYLKMRTAYTSGPPIIEGAKLSARRIR